MNSDQIIRVTCRAMGTVLSITCASLALTSTLIAAPPAPPSPAQLDNLERQSTSISQQAEQHRHKALASLEDNDERAAKANTDIKSFLKQMGQDTSLAQNQTVPPAKSAAQSAPKATPAPGAPALSSPDAKKSSTKKETTTIKVECDGGIYFDSQAGILAYLKNVRLTESKSHFKLKCNDELKVFLDTTQKKPSEPQDSKNKLTENAVNPEKTEKETTPGQVVPVPEKKEAAKKKDQSFSELGNLKQIIATGNVKVTGKDEQGKPFLASGDTASYDAITGEMILKGGRPTLQQSTNQYIQAQEPNQWIKIQMKDKRIQSIVTSEGKWAMQAVTKKTSL